MKALLWLRLAFDILYEAFMRFARDDGWAIASHIALSILTSMFPFLIFVTAVAGFFGSQNLSDEAVRILFETWPKDVAEPVATEVHNVLTRSHAGLLTISIVLALYFSANGVEALRIGLNRAYGANETRSWWLLRLESIGYVVIGAFSILILALFVVFGSLIWSAALRYAPGLQPLDRVVTLSRYGIATLVLLAALIIVHKFLPAGRRSLRDIAIGIALTFALWVAAGVAFGSYIAQFARNYVTTYAGLASVMIALVFLYMIAAIFIYGGELNAAIIRARREKASLEFGEFG